jgi:hypothetical protein
MVEPGSEVGDMSANTMNFGATVNSQTLEATAQAQRIRLHESISELRNHMHHTLNVRRQVREHLLPASAVVAGLGLIIGFGMGGIFQPGPRRLHQGFTGHSSAMDPGPAWSWREG